MGLNDVTRTLVDRGWVAADQAEEAENSLLRAPVKTEEDLVYEPPGKVIAGRYEIQRALAHGGMGSVYEAIQLGLGRRVAVKAVAEEDEELIERFRREAQALADVSHPGIVEVYDFIPVSEQTEGRCYLVMTFIEGQDLEGYLSAQPARRVPPAEAVALLRPVVSAIVELHANGILHRDLKPANIVRFVRADGQASAKLLDFGIARRAADEGLTATGSVLGTPAYIAPEAMFGRTQTPKSDVYSLGATLFELLTGAPPFGDGAPVEIIKRLMAHVIELPSEVTGTPLGDLVEQMLEMEPDKRPTALDVASTLDRLHHAGCGPEPTTADASPDASAKAGAGALAAGVSPAGAGASSANVTPAVEPQAPAPEPSVTPAATASASERASDAPGSSVSSAPAAGVGEADPLPRLGDRTDPALPLASRPRPGPSPRRGVVGILAAAVVVLLGGVVVTTWLYLRERGSAGRAAAGRGSMAPTAARTTDSANSQGTARDRPRTPASPAPGERRGETDSPARRSSAAARRAAGSMSGAPPSGVGSSRASADRPSADRASADRPSADRASADRPSTDRASADRVSADRVSADRASADRASADRPSADRPSADDEAADPRVQKLMRECRSATDARRLYARARHASRERAKQGFARAAFRALLRAGCSPPGLKRYSARYLATLLIRAGRCEQAREVWKVFRSLSPARGGRKPAFPACRPR